MDTKRTIIWTISALALMGAYYAVMNFYILKKWPDKTPPVPTSALTQPADTEHSATQYATASTQAGTPGTNPAPSIAAAPTGPAPLIVLPTSQPTTSPTTAPSSIVLG